MVLDKRRHGADLNGVRVVGRVFKKTVVRVEQLLGQEEEKLSGRAAVVQSEDTERHKMAEAFAKHDNASKGKRQHSVSLSLTLPLPGKSRRACSSAALCASTPSPG